MFFMGVGILYSTTQPNVVRNYLKALWLGDIGHAAVTYYVIGHKRAVDVANWNAMTWGNIGATVSRLLRVETVLMIFLVVSFHRQKCIPSGLLGDRPEERLKGSKEDITGLVESMNCSGERKRLRLDSLFSTVRPCSDITWKLDDC